MLHLATLCRVLGADVVHVGGVADHVHIIATLPNAFPSSVDRTDNVLENPCGALLRLSPLAGRGLR